LRADRITLASMNEAKGRPQQGQKVLRSAVWQVLTGHCRHHSQSVFGLVS